MTPPLLGLREDWGQVAAFSDRLDFGFFLDIVHELARLFEVARSVSGFAGELQSASQKILALREKHFKSQLVAAAYGALQFLLRVRVILHVH